MEKQKYRKLGERQGNAYSYKRMGEECNNPTTLGRSPFIVDHIHLADNLRGKHSLGKRKFDSLMSGPLSCWG